MSSSQSSKGKEPEVPYTPSSPKSSPTSPSSPSSSSTAPEAKRRRLEPAGPSHVYGEPFHIRSDTGSWAWYPDTIRSWIREERVPPFESLPRLQYPMELALAAFVAKMDREIRTVREAAGTITGLSQHGNAIEAGLERLRGDLTETDQLHNNLVVEVNALRNRVATAEHGLILAQARVTTAEHGLELAQARIAELEAQVAGEEEEEDPEEDPEEVPGADEAEDEDGDGEVDD